MHDLKDLIPDFDEMEELAALMAEAKARMIYLESEIESLQAKFIRQALTNSDYWPKNKPPTMSYCNSVVAKIGNTEEQEEKLRKLRLDLSDAEETYRHLRKLIDLRQDKLNLYRTESANKRKSFM
jgi:hypothetical protein